MTDNFLEEPTPVLVEKWGEDQPQNRCGSFDNGKRLQGIEPMGVKCGGYT